MRDLKNLNLVSIGRYQTEIVDEKKGLNRSQRGGGIGVQNVEDYEISKLRK